MTTSVECEAGSAELPRISQRVPDFFLVGHPKCGTTALYEMLRRHPQIYMPELKEPIFFASELPPRAHRYRAPATLAEYLLLFDAAAPGQRLGEASASYLRSPTAPCRIAQVSPAARIVAILREPASFLRSLHLQCLQSRYETERDLGKALALEDARRLGLSLPRRSRWPQALLYSDYIRYVEQLRRYRALFARDRVLVLIYDDFRRDNEATVRKVLRFLEVDDTEEIETLESNPSVRVRSPRLDDLVHAVSVGQGRAARAVKAPLIALVPRGLRRATMRTIRRRMLFDSPPPPDEALMLELRRRFKGEVLALSDYLARDLVALWGYDRLG